MTPRPKPGPAAARGSEEDLRRPILLDIVLVVEGRDMKEFFVALLKEMDLNERIDIRNAGSKDNIGSFLQALTVASGFDRVKTLGVVRDADGPPASAFANVRTALRNARLPAPDKPLQVKKKKPAVSVMILPAPDRAGMLETLCWEAVNLRPEIPCITAFLDCVKKATGHPARNPEKSRFHAYIAVQDKPGLKLGEAASAGYFPWNSSVFDQLKSFLTALVPARR